MASRTSTILVVDHQDSSRDLLSLQLRSLGYASIEASSAAEGLQLVMKHPEIDLLMVELALPGMPGLEVVEGVRALRPTLPFLIMSARVDVSLARHPEILRRPFRLEQLKAKLDVSLGGAARAAKR